MSDVSKSIMQGLQEALEYTKGNLECRTIKVKYEPVPEYKPDDIKRIRTNANMTQMGFAHFLGVTVKAVEAWEYGRNKPNGSARRLMSVVEKDPKFPSQYYDRIEHYGYVDKISV